MELPNDAPRLPKTLFLLSDVAFLAVAAFLAYQADSPPSTATIVGIIVCAGLGVAIGVAPFIIDYARAQDRQLSDRQSELEALVRTTSSAADQASIAANGLNEIATLTRQNLESVEALPQRIAEARSEALARTAANEKTDWVSLRAEVAALRDDLKKQLKPSAAPEPDPTTAAALEKLQTGLDQLTDRLAHIQTQLQELAERPTTLTEPVPPSPQPATETSEPTEEKPAKSPPKPKKKAAPKSKVAAKPAKPAPPPEPSLFDASPEDTADESESAEDPRQPTGSLGTLNTADAESDTIYDSVDDDGSDIVEEAPPAPSAPEPEPEAEAQSESEPEPEPGPENEETASAASENEAAEPSPVETLDEPAPEEPSLSSDGKTRLTVTAYLGIGNRLFVRGEGPGLSPDEGTPLQFVSIGKWRWETDAANGPVKLTLWKNDQQPCSSTGEIELQPGSQFETSASF